MANLLVGIPYLRVWEGKHSKAKTDSAHKNPSPYVKDGVKGWHTNKGVTWVAFQQAAQKFGFAVNEYNFMVMPDAIWLPIFTDMYAKPMQADKCVSDAVALVLADWAWASGVFGAGAGLAKRMKAKHNIVIRTGKTIDMKKAVDFYNKMDEKTAFLELMDFRRDFFRSLNDPDNIKGWLNRMDGLQTLGLELIAKKKAQPQITA